MTSHIVRDVEVKGISDDLYSTLIRFNDECFAFSLEKLKEHQRRVNERVAFLEELQKSQDKKCSD